MNTTPEPVNPMAADVYTARRNNNVDVDDAQTSLAQTVGHLGFDFDSAYLSLVKEPYSHSFTNQLLSKSEEIKRFGAKQKDKADVGEHGDTKDGRKVYGLQLEPEVTKTRLLP